ncbi:nucleolar protein 4-like b isoform X1 [Tachysurus ichikawai]
MTGTVIQNGTHGTAHGEIAETYAFLPREAVTRFLMGCGECQKRMHISPSGAECKGTASKSSLKHLHT